MRVTVCCAVLCSLFGCPAAAADSGALRAIRAAGTAAPTLEFGAVQTQHAGSAADIRKKFAGSSI